MIPHGHRLEALINSCPSGITTAVSDLLLRVRAPAGAEMLLQTISVIEDALEDVTDEIPGTPLNKYRKAAIACLKQMARAPRLSDDSFGDYRSITADPLYQAIFKYSPRDPWEQRTLLRALLYWVLLESPEKTDIEGLLNSIKHPPILSSIANPPESIVLRIALIGEYFQMQGSRESSSAKVAVCLQAILQALLASSPTPERFRIADEHRQALADAIEGDGPQKRVLTPSEQLKKLVVSINTRIGHSIRHLHTPVIDQLPEFYEVADYLRAARQYNPVMGDWLSINTLLSTFSTSLFGVNTSHRCNVAEHWGSSVLHIMAPDLGKRTAMPKGEAWEDVNSRLQLSIPNRILMRVKENRCTPDFDSEKLKMRANGFTNAWADDHGVRIKPSTLRRFLPFMLSGRSAIDATLLHLLGLSDIARRDAGIHYFSPSISSLQERYRSAVVTLADLIAQPEWLSDGWSEAPKQDGCFGASARPSQEAVSKLIQFLKDGARRSRGRLSLERRIRSFNMEAAYLTVLYLASTGARPVEDVFPDTSQWSHETAELLVSEKDSLLYRSTRKLPIVERLNQGVSRFTEHRRDFEVQLGRRFDRRLLVFLTNEHGEAVSPTIANMKSLIPGFSDHWPWSNDIWRHYFRSRLWELGCSAFVLERAMGHLSKSQTPDMPLAMQPIASSMQTAVPYINRLLDEVGF